MEKNKKDLKIYSILILVFVAISLVKIIVSACVNGLPQLAEIPEGMTKETVQIVSIVAFVISFIVLIPQIYVGIKGVKIGTGATANGKAHMIWAIILAVLACVSTISAIIELTKVFDFSYVLNALDAAVDALLFISYYLLARKIAAKN